MDCNEGHAESCACLRPGDRECDCHKSYGFETAEDMDIADASKGSACACPLDHVENLADEALSYFNLQENDDGHSKNGTASA